MDELFTRYMYYLRALEGNKSTSTEALRKFYERNKYQYLNSENTMLDLKKLAAFWQSIKIQDNSKFSNEVLKKLYILNYAPNGMWQNLVSTYFLHFKDHKNLLDNELFLQFLNKITAFIYTYAITNPGVNALRTPAFDEMVNLVNNNDVSFSKYRFDETHTRTLFETYKFTNQRSITRSILTWYAFTLKNQPLLNLNESFHIEHIFAKKRYQMEQGLEKVEHLELLGNKILLEESINIRASDYRFEDKQKIYSGEVRRGSYSKPSQIDEISLLIQKNKFDEEDIISRNNLILDAFFQYLRAEDLLIAN